jgi:hypothetical protein
MVGSLAGLPSPRAVAYVKDAFIFATAKGSDHCPLGVEVDPATLGEPDTSTIGGVVAAS